MYSKQTITDYLNEPLELSPSQAEHFELAANITLGNVAEIAPHLSRPYKHGEEGAITRKDVLLAETARCYALLMPKEFRGFNTDHIVEHGVAMESIPSTDQFRQFVEDHATSSMKKLLRAEELHDAEWSPERDAMHQDSEEDEERYEDFTNAVANTYDSLPMLFDILEKINAGAPVKPAFLEALHNVLIAMRDDYAESIVDMQIEYEEDPEVRRADLAGSRWVELNDEMNKVFFSEDSKALPKTGDIFSSNIIPQLLALKPDYLPDEAFAEIIDILRDQWCERHTDILLSRKNASERQNSVLKIIYQHTAAPEFTIETPVPDETGTLKHFMHEKELLQIAASTVSDLSHKLTGRRLGQGQSI